MRPKIVNPGMETTVFNILNENPQGLSIKQMEKMLDLERGDVELIKAIRELKKKEIIRRKSKTSTNQVIWVPF